MLQTAVNVVWGIVCFLGVVTFFAGNGGKHSVSLALPLLLGSVSYCIAFKCFTLGLLYSSLIGIVVFIALIFAVYKSPAEKKHDEK